MPVPVPGFPMGDPWEIEPRAELSLDSMFKLSSAKFSSAQLILLTMDHVSSHFGPVAV